MVSFGMLIRFTGIAGFDYLQDQLPTLSVNARVDSDQPEQNGEDYVIDNKFKVLLLLASDRETAGENARDQRCRSELSN